jgi:PAS domain S-box-containing protein
MPYWRSRTVEASRSAEYLRIAQTTIGFGVWDTNLATGETRWSPELERLFGLEPGEFAGTYSSFKQFIHPEDRSRYERESSRIVAIGRSPFEMEFRVLLRDGALRWLCSRGVITYEANGMPSRVVGVNFDITERKLRDAELREKDEYLRVALKRSELQIFHQDARLRYTWVANPRLDLSDVVGRTDEEILGSKGSALSRIKRRALRTGRGQHEEVCISRDGRAGCYDLFVEPQRDDDGRVTGVICASTDITARKQALRELEEAHRRSQELATHLTDSVEAEREALARDVHDQVGALLTALRMRIAAAGRAVPEGAIDLRSELLDAEAMTEAAMLATREICSRLRPAALQDLGLVETCRWYVEDWANSTGLRIKGRFAKLRAEPDPGLGIDLFRILQELLTNVAKHAGAKCVDVTLAAPRGALRLVVADDGCGFNPDAPQNGFGLAGIRERARHHDGRVSIDTGPRGSKITVTLKLRGKP